MSEEQESNVLKLNVAKRDPHLSQLMDDLAEAVNKHVSDIPAITIIGALEFIKQDVAQQVMEVFGGCE